MHLVDFSFIRSHLQPPPPTSLITRESECQASSLREAVSNRSPSRRTQGRSVAEPAPRRPSNHKKRYGASAAEHRANTKPKRTLRTERRDLGRLQARVIPPVTGGRNLQARRVGRTQRPRHGAKRASFSGAQGFAAGAPPECKSALPLART